MIAYLTYGESPTGIYLGQVIDTCKILSKMSGTPIKLISLISIRKFRYYRGIIKLNYPNSIVLPMFPTAKLWKFNILNLVILCAFNRNKIFICRNALPTTFGLWLRTLKLIKFVVYDGRGAEYEQIREYDVYDEQIGNQMHFYEKKAINQSDFQISVSNELIYYWEKNYQYSKTSNLVIPCTLNSSHETNNGKRLNRKDIGFSNDDIILVFSGSLGGWQSFDLIFEFLSVYFENNSNVKALFLCNENKNLKYFMDKYPNKIFQKWCPPSDVSSYLSICDYGLLLRENTITNQVASPVKFAEYLFCGLNIIISPVLKDFANFVEINQCGYVYNNKILGIKAMQSFEKETNVKLALKYFSKNSEYISEKYNLLIKIFNNVN